MLPTFSHSERRDTQAIEGETLDLGLMADFLPGSYSRKAVKRAGEALSGELKEDPGRWLEYVEIFKIAHEWRRSHVVPMRLVQQELRRVLGKVNVVGITAARMKRMASIRRKLRTSSTSLDQMQDIGGCRAIVGSMDDLRAMVDHYRAGGSKHRLRRHTSYLAKPRSSGYRSDHFILDFCPPSELTKVYEGRRIELQIRTQLQHSWSTAVEAVGLVRGEDLKSGEGDPDWLRIFALVSAEHAEAEGTPPAADAPNQSDRRAEIIELERKLDAIRTLQNLKKAFRVAEFYQTDSEYFLIKYDNVAGKVDVRGFNRLSAGDSADALQTQERSNDAVTTVLVEVARMEDLRVAYPNYFGDVTLFVKNLRSIVADGLLALRSGKGSVPSAPMDLSFVHTWDTDRLTVRRRKRPN